MEGVYGALWIGKIPSSLTKSWAHTPCMVPKVLSFEQTEFRSRAQQIMTDL